MRKYLEALCPHYMAIGMTYDEFWHGEIERWKYYREAHEIQRSILNQQAWLEGLYNYRAFSSVMGEAAYGFSGKKGRKPEGYIDSPYPITEREKAAAKRKREEYTRAWFLKGQKDGETNAS